MSLWKDARTPFDDVGKLAHEPSGGPAKRWLAGVVLAALPVVYGIDCIVNGHTLLYARGRNFEDLTGEAGIWLAVAYMALGAFAHFHWFWGLSERLWRFSQLGKGLSLLVFVPSLLYALYRHFP